MESVKFTSSKTTSLGRALQRSFVAVSSLLVCSGASACRDTLAPTARVLPVAPVMRPDPGTFALGVTSQAFWLLKSNADIVKGTL